MCTIILIFFSLWNQDSSVAAWADPKASECRYYHINGEPHSGTSWFGNILYQLVLKTHPENVYEKHLTQDIGDNANFILFTPNKTFMVTNVLGPPFAYDKRLWKHSIPAKNYQGHGDSEPNQGPGNINKTVELKPLPPNVCYLVIIRNPIASACSGKQKHECRRWDWYIKWLYVRWEAMRLTQEQYGNSRVFLSFYYDWKLDPYGSILSLADYLGLSITPAQALDLTNAISLKNMKNTAMTIGAWSAPKNRVRTGELCSYRPKLRRTELKTAESFLQETFAMYPKVLEKFKCS